MASWLKLPKPSATLEPGQALSKSEPTMVPVPQDGRCPFHCLHLSQMTANQVRAWAAQPRNLVGNPVTAEGWLDAPSYTMAREAAQVVARPYAEHLRKEGKHKEADGVDNGHVLVEGRNKHSMCHKVKSNGFAEMVAKGHPCGVLEEQGIIVKEDCEGRRLLERR